MIGNHNRVAWRLASLAMLLPLPTALASVDLERRDVIATGDVVPGFGLIGTGSFQIIGIDRSGRILVGAELSSGEEILLFADGRKITTLWRTGQPADGPLRLAIQSADLSPTGRVAAEAIRYTDEFESNSVAVAIVTIDGRRLRTVAAVGDATPDGGVICDIGAPHINDAGDVAFGARVSESLAGCDQLEHWAAIYVRRGDATHLEVSTREFTGEIEFRLRRIAADGSVVFVVSPDLGDAPEGVSVSRDGVRRCIVDEADGCSGKYGRAIGASPSGEVVLHDRTFRMERVYRTDRGVLRPVVMSGDVLPEGRVIASFGETAFLNDDGDLVLSVQWDQNGIGTFGTVFFPASGAPIILTESGYPGGLNDSDQIALRSSYPPSDQVARWSGGSIEPILATSDAVSGGAVFAEYGLFGYSCLSEDGRVGVTATGTDYSQGLVCRDAKGIHLLARHGQPAPGGGSFVNFFGCAFADGPRLVFMATVESSAVSLYAATDDGLERVIGRGDAVPGGTTVGDIEFQDPFAVSRDGTVVLRRTEYEQLLRRRPGGALERVVLHPRDGRLVTRIDSFGLADDGRVVAAVELSSPREWALVVEDAGRGSVVTTTTDETLAGGPFVRFTRVLASGQKVAFNAIDEREHSSVFGYDLQTGVSSALLPPDPSRIFPRLLFDFASSAGLMFAENSDDAGFPYTTYLLDGGEIRFLFRRISIADSEPVQLNDRGNILFYADRSPLGADRHSLSLAGPDPEAVCPEVLEQDVDQPRHDGDGCQIEESPVPSPVVSIVVVALATCGWWRARRSLARAGIPAGFGSQNDSC